MPRLIRLYITQIAIGFALSAVFVGGILVIDLGGLRGLIVRSDVGWLALLLLWAFNGIVFAGVQFGIRIMGMQERPDPPDRGNTVPVTVPVPAKAVAHR